MQDDVKPIVAAPTPTLIGESEGVISVSLHCRGCRNKIASIWPPAPGMQVTLHCHACGTTTEFTDGVYTRGDGRILRGLYARSDAKPAKSNGRANDAVMQQTKRA